MSKSVRKGALLATGYGLARAVTANSYNTAFGAESGTSLGLVAQTSFSVVTNLVSAAVAVAMVALVLRGFARSRAGLPAGVAFRAGRIPFALLLCSCVVLLVGYAVGALGLFNSLGVGTGALTCGIVYAVGSVALTLAWFEPFALEPETSVAVHGLVCGFLVQAGGFFVLSWLTGWWLFAAVLLMLGASCAIRRVLADMAERDGAAGEEGAPSLGDRARGACREDGTPGGKGAVPPAPGQARSGGSISSRAAGASGQGGLASPVPDARSASSPTGVAGLFKSALGGLFGSFLCVFMLTAVVGLLHSSVIGGAFEPVVGAVPMSESLVLAAVLLTAVVFLSRRVPTTASVYRVLFPLMLVALSVLPFIPGAFGHYAGMVMVVCYNLVGMAFVLFLVETAHSSPVPQVALMGVYQAGTQLFTVVGLALGLFLNTLEARAEASYATILILVCIYLLAMVPAVLSRRSDKGSDRVAVEGVAGEPAQAGGDVAPASPLAAGVSVGTPSEQDFEQQQEVRGRVGARVEEWALARGLTAREAQVLVQLARGWSANAIAADLGIAQNTAWAHIKRIYVKLDVHSKQELIEYIEREVIDRQE